MLFSCGCVWVFVIDNEHTQFKHSQPSHTDQAGHAGRVHTIKASLFWISRP